MDTETIRERDGRKYFLEEIPRQTQDIDDVWASFAPFPPTTEVDRMVVTGLRMGRDTHGVASLVLEHPRPMLYLCYIGRPYFEYAVKLLWAVTQPDGLNRYKQGILDAEKDWAQKMTKRTGPSPVWDAMLAEQRVHSPNPMPANNMLQLMTDVYASDLYTELTAEQKKTRAEKDYQFFIGTLHRILHCDQTFLQIGLWRDDEANAFLGDFKFLLYVPTFFICRAAGIVRGWKTRGLEFLPEEFKNTSQGGAE